MSLEMFGLPKGPTAMTPREEKLQFLIAHWNQLSLDARYELFHLAWRHMAKKRRRVGVQDYQPW